MKLDKFVMEGKKKLKSIPKVGGKKNKICFAKICTM
jgi:hypothetical protein